MVSSPHAFGILPLTGGLPLSEEPHKAFPLGIRVLMADYNKFDRRIDSLVVETRTSFSPEVTGLAVEDSQWISKAIHHHPEWASQISYERAHTGFIRDIVVTAADVARLYETQAR